MKEYICVYYRTVPFPGRYSNWIVALLVVKGASLFVCSLNEEERKYKGCYRIMELSSCNIQSHTQWININNSGNVDRLSKKVEDTNED